MLTYHAAYYRYPDSKWIIARVLDFPGVVSQGRTLPSARRMIRDALRLMAECSLEEGEPLPRPKRRVSDKKQSWLNPSGCSFAPRRLDEESQAHAISATANLREPPITDRA